MRFAQHFYSKYTDVEFYCCISEQEHTDYKLGNISHITNLMICAKRVPVKSMKAIFWFKTKERQGKVRTTFFCNETLMHTVSLELEPRPFYFALLN